MTTGATIDGVLVQWGERLFYPRNRIVRTDPPARLDALTRRKAAVIRSRIVATVSRRAAQVMIKVTGGGRGMGAITAHFRYISKYGRLDIEDDRGVVRNGKEAVPDLADQWRYGGTFIDEVSHRREAFNIMLSMPHGTPSQIVLHAAREFAQAELRGHRYVMVLHEHQANPHVHLSVRAESDHGVRLNPRKTDLHRWRETFAEKLRGWGIEAEATRQATRGANRRPESLWRLKAREDGRLLEAGKGAKSGGRYRVNRMGALEAWAQIARSLEESDRPEDRALAEDVMRFVRESPFFRQEVQARQREATEPDKRPSQLMPENVEKNGPDRGLGR